MANRLSTSATNNGTGHWLEAGAGTLAETGLLASSTIDFACAAASFAAASWPLVSIRCCVSRSRSAGCSDAFGGVDSGLLAGAFLAGAFLAAAFLAGAFLAGAFLAGAFFPGGFAGLFAGLGGGVFF